MMTTTSVRKMDGARSWYYLFATGLAIMMNAGSTLCSFGIYVVVFSKYFNETNTMIGWIGASAYGILSFTYPLPVYLRRRFGFRAMVSLAAILYTMAHIITPFAPSAGYLLLTYSLPIGFSTSIIDCLSVMSIREYFKKYLNWATGIRFASVMFGSICFNYLIPILIDVLGWKKLYFCFSSFGIFIIIFGFSYQGSSLPEEKRSTVLMDDVSEVKESGKKVKSRDFLRRKRFRILCFVCFLTTFSSLVPPMFVVQYATTLGHPLSKAKWTLFGHSCGSLTGRLTGGVVTHILSQKWEIFFSIGGSLLLYALSSALVTLTNNLWLLVAYMATIGYLEGTFFVMLVMIMNDVTKGGDVDYAYSVICAVMGVGYLFGSPAMGWLFDVTGDFRLVLYVVASCITFAGTIPIGSALTKRLCNKKRSNNDPKIDCVGILLRDKCSLVPEKETVI